MSLAARAEQEIRAYPRLHAAFYSAIARNEGVRLAAGRVKNSVRGVGDIRAAVPLRLDDAGVAEARAAAVARRLGLPGTGL
ncbi:MAG: hypothetical protein NVS3B26_11540 [Mycobacteriales bacterium]